MKDVSKAIEAVWKIESARLIAAWRLPSAPAALPKAMKPTEQGENCQGLTEPVKRRLAYVDNLQLQ